jgi:hypothetical protein
MVNVCTVPAKKPHPNKIICRFTPRIFFLATAVPGVTDVERNVPHSRSGAVPMSSLSGVGQLGFWEIGKGGTIG